jgi:hypothetical protein
MSMEAVFAALCPDGCCWERRSQSGSLWDAD